MNDGVPTPLPHVAFCGPFHRACSTSRHVIYANRVDHILRLVRAGWRGAWAAVPQAVPSMPPSPGPPDLSLHPPSGVPDVFSLFKAAEDPLNGGLSNVSNAVK